ncbi:response regulator transcription factor [Streptomyces sp. DSM 41529]|uniref:Response regulator transcription factor n=1 Tax=Streptomyces lonegramiae TaxID=3075524 RepID=A0ABU2XJ43_9ACTN|nr:response regulator transcription factor [Streptomyces sp. DSM 41529]MDT0545432.1 response regulator transcription factor [Streptomyces sp. DSM 41529]
MREEGKITIFLLDDHEILRRGVHELLSGEPDMAVVGEAGTVAEALARIPDAHPDVALLDLRLPDGSGVEVCREVRAHHPEVRCLMLSSFADDTALIDAIMAGAYGYVLKDIGSDELLAAVRDVAAGRSLLDPAATARMLERVRAGGGAGLSTGTGTGMAAARLGDDLSADLTDQERRILVLIGEGLTNRAIGERLHLAEKTIKNYVSGVLAKLGMERRSQAAAYVARFQARTQAPAQAPSQTAPQAPSQASSQAPSQAPAEARKTQPQKH